jgi:hypothetical protein
MEQSESRIYVNEHRDLYIERVDKMMKTIMPVSITTNFICSEETVSQEIDYNKELKIYNSVAINTNILYEMNEMNYIFSYYTIPFIERYEGIIHWIETERHSYIWKYEDAPRHVFISKSYCEIKDSNKMKRLHRGYALPIEHNQRDDEKWFIAFQERKMVNGFDSLIHCCIAMDTNIAWIMIDLGRRNSVHLTEYSLGCESHMNIHSIQWSLQGAMDTEEQEWITLHTHDATEIQSVFMKHECMGTWKIIENENICKTLPTIEYYRYFRIIQTIDELRRTKKTYKGYPRLSCTNFEIFGTLRIKTFI